MEKLIATVRNNPFLRHNLVFFAGSIAVGALNYVYYPILGRLLSPAAFGEVQTLISLFLQLTTFLMVLSIITVGVVTNNTNKAQRAHIILEFEKVALLGALALLGAVIVGGEQLRQLLQFESQWPFVLLATALVVTVPFTSRTAYLRGVQRFGATSLANMVVAGGKVACSALLVILGFGTIGAIAGLVIAQLAAFIYAAAQARASGFVPPLTHKKFAWPRSTALSSELRYALFVLLGSLGVTVLFSMDVVVAKLFFDAHTAGLYAGIAAVARIIFFLTASIPQVLMPAIKAGQSARAQQRLLQKSLLLLVGISAPVVLVCMLAPGFIVPLLMGQAYAAYAPLLPILGVATFLLSVLNLVVVYFLALRNYAPAVLTMTGALVTGGTLVVLHPSLQAMVGVIAVGAATTLGAVGIWAYAARPRH